MKFIKFILLLVIYSIGSSNMVAQTVIKGEKKNLKKIQLPEMVTTTNNGTNTNTASQNNAGAYSAGSTIINTDVTSSGGLSNTIPIEIPAGIKDIVPSVSLVYNGQGGNGIAGFGWNIAGVSKITKVAASSYYDNLIDPVDFDSNDRYALDG